MTSHLYAHSANDWLFAGVKTGIFRNSALTPMGLPPTTNLKVESYSECQNLDRLSYVFPKEVESLYPSPSNYPSHLLFHPELVYSPFISSFRPSYFA